MDTIARRLTAALTAAGVPIIGVSIGDPTNRRTWRIDFAPEATAQDRTAAAILVASFDATEPAAPAPVVPLAPVRKVDFLRQLRPSEYQAFITAGDSGDATLLYARALFDAAPEIKLDDPTFVELLAAVIGAGILTPDRATEILAHLKKPA